ncbi:diguanylate cyclase [Pseudoxanthobacter sp. M-2]|uniref:sensor domain-containing diguanylate cyclase n=1 Tax=Pseudoxanthobacter sp. M-2 TaxID=3078754 RepID=UPI0038FD281D
MRDAMLDGGFAVAVIDALTSHICVVDRDGVIVAVNQTWKDFTAANSNGKTIDHIGVSYLDVCRSSTGLAALEAPEFLKGLRAVLRGDDELFQIEYPCHSPTELRWFLARVSPLRRRDSPVTEGAVVSHMNITDRKLVELDVARLAATDALTGIPNRRFFDEFSAIEFSRVQRFGEPLSVLMIDLDHFKVINDENGHPAGDEVLRKVAMVGFHVLRACDALARIGGEEFVCLLPGTDAAGARVAAEKLRLEIEQLSIKVGQDTLSVTASIGVGAVCPGDTSISDAMRRADEALYLAKSAGRNCVRVQPDCTTEHPSPA